MHIIIGILLILISLYIYGDYSSYRNGEFTGRVIYYGNGPYIVLFCLILLVGGIVLFFI